MPATDGYRDVASTDDSTHIEASPGVVVTREIGGQGFRIDEATRRGLLQWMQTALLSAHHFDDLSGRIEIVEGFLEPIEGFALYWLARNWRAPGRVVEIGSFKGRSTCWLAAACKERGDGKVTAIDHFRGSPEHGAGGSHADPDIAAEGSTLPVFCRNLQGVELLDFVEVRVGSCEEVSRSWREPIRLLFLDADHDGDAVARQVAAWAPFLGRHALVAFHDVQVWPGVTEVYTRLRDDTTHWRELAQIKSLGVLEVIADGPGPGSA